MTSILLAVAALGGAVLHLLLSRVPRTPERIAEIFLGYLLVVGFGLQSALDAYGCFFRADEIASTLGWPAGSPFQFEVGVAFFGVAVMGMLCLVLRGAFWAAVAINASILYFGTGIARVRQVWGSHADFRSLAPLALSHLLFPVIAMGLLTGYLSLTSQRRVRSKSGDSPAART